MLSSNLRFSKHLFWFRTESPINGVRQIVPLLQAILDLACFIIPDKKGYYDMFFNELEINKRIRNSQLASNVPKLLVSSYWNGLSGQPMHIFE